MAEKGAKIKFVADTSKFNDSIKKANSEIKLMSAELKLNAKEMARTGESAEGLEKEHKLLTNQLKASEDKTEALNQKIEKAIECFGENSTEVTNLRTQLANAKTEQEKFRIMLGGCNEKLEEQRRVEAELNSETRKLTDTISEQESKLSKLKKEYVDATLEYGESSSEVRQLARDIRELSGELNENKEKLSQASKKADALDQSLENVEEAAEDAGDGFSVLDGAMSVLLANGISSLVGGIGDAITGFANLSDETQEYREDIVKLNTAFESAGHTTRQATSVYKELYSVFGEEDRAVEAAQQIANISKNEEDMARMTEIATGAWARWGDSLATESLMEAISASSKMSSVQGTLADALDWSAKEGELFGLKLKENIKFTELSSQQLKGLTEQQKKEYAARKKQYESIEAYNKQITEAASASEVFTIALQECGNEEERLALILDTLDGLYSQHAQNYKLNNKSIIAARKATSDYNDVLAEIGEDLEPINTDFKEMNTVLLKGLAPTIKKQVVPAFGEFTDELEESGVLEGFSGLVGELAEDGLPILADTLGFVTENYKELAVGIGFTVAALETMSVVTKVTAGLEGATTAMGVFNAVMSANPIGAVVTSLGFLAAGLAIYNMDDVDDTTESISALTEAEQELIETSKKTAEAFRDKQEQIDKTNQSTVSEMDHTKKLAEELIKLADANGKVQETDQVRAQFILNEMNEALGTEYKLVDGVIQNYENLEKSIYDVINAKTANALLETKNEEYVLAIQEKDAALQAVNNTYREYHEQRAASVEKIKEWEAELEELRQKRINGVGMLTTQESLQLNTQITNLSDKIKKEKGLLEEKKNAYDTANTDYASYLNTIAEYENAAMLVQEGNYQDAIDLLKNKSGAFWEYSDNVSQATQDVIDSLYKEAVQARIEAERTKENFENGIEGYTKEMVDEAQQGYQDALDKWANAFLDAQSVGKDLSNGLEKGMTSKKSSLIEKAKDIIENIISAMRKEADSHSPSRKTIDFGEDMGEGAEIGLDNKTDDVVKSAKRQVSEVMDAYHLDLSKPVSVLGGLNDLPIHQDVYSPLEQSINSGDLVTLSNAISELANRPVIVKVSDRAIAEATASASDDVNGTRNAFISRGLILE